VVSSNRLSQASAAGAQRLAQTGPGHCPSPRRRFGPWGLE